MKKLIFISGTRADFGKIYPLLKCLKQNTEFQFKIFVTGMHMLEKYGYTFIEIQREFKDHLILYKNQPEDCSNSLDLILSQTINGFNEQVFSYKPDLIVVHGDRVEALAGAIVGSLNNILTAHIEGGEVSGTIDDLIRHSITKLCHLHLVSNEFAKKRLLQLGESCETIHIIGSPEIDIMLSDDLPSLEDSMKHYDLPWKNFSLFCYHPVTTEISEIRNNIENIYYAILESNLNYVIIEPNNDPGTKFIYEKILLLKQNKNIRSFPSISHKHYLTLLKNCNFIIGNSSSGVREAPIYAKPSINIGSRQRNRNKQHTIINCSENKENILYAISRAQSMEVKRPSYSFGKKGVAQRFINILRKDIIWKINLQKAFVDLND